MLRANAGWDDLTLTEQRNGLAWQSLLELGAGELILRTAILFDGGLVLMRLALPFYQIGRRWLGTRGAT